MKTVASFLRDALQLTRAGEVDVAAFLLWNVQNRNRDLLVQSLVREHKIDVVLLVEYSPTRTGSDLSNLLQRHGLVKRSTSERFGVFGRVSYTMTLSSVTIGTRLELWDWAPDSGVGGRFALAHGLDSWTVTLLAIGLPPPRRELAGGFVPVVDPRFLVPP